jgi:hypothetical protein
MMQGPYPSLISEAERQAYGDEALSVMERKAREVVRPVMQDMERQTQQLRNELQRVKSQDIYDALDQRLPGWREINQSPDFLSWLATIDPPSGMMKSGLLRDAFNSGDANRVIAFFTGFLNTQQPAATARTRSADNSRTITDKDIERFYERVRKGLYENRPKEKAAEEAQIHRAIMEGRLRRTA